MLILKIEHPSIVPRAARRVIVCPQCGNEIECFVCPPTICSKCKEDLPDIAEILTSKTMRVKYHRKGRYEQYFDKG